ncbi:DUF3618 domain-containing protein [Nonomuraea sp. NPDC049309]|uniref:DUF3618 domain-containing protein n=1 Tax=Nonomuraea sp. NPDC049309 TaxID=3364350 RepID=UPI00372049BD
MSETDPGFSRQHAGYVGSRRATVGEPTDPESMNVPQTRPGAAENAHMAELAREGHETFIPETPVRDEREDAAEHSRTEEKSLRGSRGGKERRTSSRMSTQGEAVPARGDGHGTAHAGTSEREASGRRSPPATEDDLRREIEETRRELGATVGALMAKANVKSWAGHAAGRARARARDRAGHAREVAREHAGHAAEVARERAAVVKGRASHLADVAGKARDGVPEHVRDAAAGAGRRPALLVVMVAAGAVSAFALRRMMRERSMASHRTTLGRTLVHLSMTGRMPPRRTLMGRTLSDRMLSGRMLSGRMLSGRTLSGRMPSRRTGLRWTGGTRAASRMTLPGGAELRRSVERRIGQCRTALRQGMAARSMPGRTLSQRTALSEAVARRMMPARTTRGRSMAFRTMTRTTARRPMALRRLVEVGRHRDRIRIVIRLP